MKILVDENMISRRLMARLQAAGHDVIMADDVGLLSVEVDLDASELFGRTLGMRDVITFQGKTVEEARKSFEESVDFYLSCCEQEGAQPDPPYSGRWARVCGQPKGHRR